MIPKDIQDSLSDELLLEEHLLWKLLDNISLKHWDELEQRRKYIVYELAKRTIPVQAYHYLIYDERLKTHYLSWTERRYKHEIALEGTDKESGTIFTRDDFKLWCKQNNISDAKYSCYYAIKVNGSIYPVMNIHCNAWPSAFIHDAERTDFPYIVAYKR